MTVVFLVLPTIPNCATRFVRAIELDGMRILKAELQRKEKKKEKRMNE